MAYRKRFFTPAKLPLNVMEMVTDSLRYWVNELHIDGFRFDLGTILAREPGGFDDQSGFLKACHQDPVLRTVKLIAEPWDCGPGGYQVGGFPSGWAEWNDRYRDTVRDFWKGHAVIGDLAQRLCASGDVFNRRGRRPWACVNFITAHDGFTLADLVTYNEKHNTANGEENRDGTTDNRSWNCGVEGPSEDPAIMALRERQMRNMLATLLLSQGTPMVLAGDELGRSQQGNNNAYCQDNELSWVHWERALTGGSLVQFVQKLCALRHQYPVLRRNLFLTGHVDEELGIKDVTWISPTGTEMQASDWGETARQSLGMLIDGRARPTGVPQRGTQAAMLLLLNAHHEGVEFILPECFGGSHWRLELDTHLTATVPAYLGAPGDPYQIEARALSLFIGTVWPE